MRQLKICTTVNQEEIDTKTQSRRYKCELTSISIFVYTGRAKKVTPRKNFTSLKLQQINLLNLQSL